ncbi:MAG: imidazole glycerol phosphate synthase subunit HisF [Rectinema sp.]
MNGLAVRIIPCLDFKDGRVVKGTRFLNLVDSGDPLERALLYERQGADELAFLDISATLEGRKTMAQEVARIRQVLSIPIMVGGGIGSIEDACRLLEAGADRISVNSAAVRNPLIIDELASRFGVQCVVVAIDVAENSTMPSGYEVKIDAGSRKTGFDAVAWAQEASGRGAGEILLTSIDRDGTSLGYECRLIGLVARAVLVPVVASGGASKAEHFLEGYLSGASALLAAGIFHRGEISIREIKEFLKAHDVEVRL